MLCCIYGIITRFSRITHAVKQNLADDSYGNITQPRRITSADRMYKRLTILSIEPYVRSTVNKVVSPLATIVCVT